MRCRYLYWLPWTAESLLEAMLFVSATAHAPVTDWDRVVPPAAGRHEIVAASPDPPFANQMTLIAFVDGCCTYGVTLNDVAPHAAHASAVASAHSHCLTHTEFISHT